MSNKNKKYNIYYENNDKQNIYIEICDLTDCCFEIWDIEGDRQSRAKIKISVKAWREMLKKWASSNIKKGDEYDYL